MRPIVTNRLALSGLSVCHTLVSPTKTVAPIEMPFGLRTRVGPGNHVLDGGPYPPWERAILRGKKGRATVKYRDNLRSSVQKMAEPIETPFGSRTRVGQSSHVLDGSPDPPREGAILGEGAAHCKVSGQFGVKVTSGYSSGQQAYFRSLRCAEMPSSLFTVHSFTTQRLYSSY